MKSPFYLFAALMVVLALAILLTPLLRRRRRSRGTLVLALSVALALPLAAAGLYQLVGTPIVLEGVTRQADPPRTFEQALQQLRQHQATAPSDVGGWLLLAQTYTAMHRSSDALDAYDHVLQLNPSSLPALVGWAEADIAARPDHRIEGRARQLLDQAARIDPRNQRVLWLTGIGQFQAAQYREAATTWRELLPMLDANSKVAAVVSAQIAEAARRAGADQTSPPAAAAPMLRVHVSVAPALRSRITPDDTLFVFARAAGGAPMPLAVVRLQARALPATVALSDAAALSPNAKLSSASAVFIGARISKTGQADAQPGDLEGDAGIVARDQQATVEINIDKVHG